MKHIEKQAAFIAMLWSGLLADPACADNTCVNQNTMLDGYGKGFYGLLRIVLLRLSATTGSISFDGLQKAGARAPNPSGTLSLH